MGAAFVVDASVVVDYLSPPARTGTADRLFAGLAWRDPLELYAADFILLETGNALRKLGLRRSISERALEALAAQLPHLALRTVPCGNLFEEAWTHRANMTVYDAAYAGLARALGQPLVTSDDRLARACRDEGLIAYSLGGGDFLTVLDTLERAGREA